MAASEGFGEFLREQLTPLGPLVLRRMFGATGVFRDGVMFAIVADDTLYVRVDADNRATFAEAAAEPPLSYEKQGRRVDLAYWRVPDRLLDEPEELLTWARAALAAARRVAAARRKAGTKRR